MTDLGEIRIQNLSKTYSGAEKAALKSISLTVQVGSFFGLLGPNGSGKTTLISILCGILSPDEGEVHMARHRLGVDDQKIQPLIALVPQHIALYEELTLYENIKYFATLYGLSGDLRQQRITECLKRVGLTNVAKRKVASYSGGMKRRANIAVSMVHQPKILFLDEPTVGIDPQSRIMIFDCLRDMNQQGTTVFYTTHYLEEAEALCTDVAILDEGKVIAQAAPETLIADYDNCSNLNDVFFHLTKKNSDRL